MFIFSKNIFNLVKSLLFFFLVILFFLFLLFKVSLIINTYYPNILPPKNYYFIKFISSITIFIGVFGLLKWYIDKLDLKNTELLNNIREEIKGLDKPILNLTSGLNYSSFISSSDFEFLDFIFYDKQKEKIIIKNLNRITGIYKSFVPYKIDKKFYSKKLVLDIYKFKPYLFNLSNKLFYITVLIAEAEEYIDKEKIKKYLLPFKYYIPFLDFIFLNLVIYLTLQYRNIIIDPIDLSKIDDTIIIDKKLSYDFFVTLHSIYIIYIEYFKKGKNELEEKNNIKWKKYTKNSLTS